MNATGWIDTQVLCYAGLHLDGRAADWYSKQDFNEWAAFKKAVLDRFGMDSSKMLLKVSRRRQGDRESVRDFADALRSFGREANVHPVETMLYHFFLEGLQDEYRAFVLTRRPKTFEEAVAEAEYYEEHFVRRNDEPVQWEEDEPECIQTPPLTPRQTGCHETRTMPNQGIEELARQFRGLNIQLAHLLHLQDPTWRARPLKSNERANVAT